MPKKYYYYDKCSCGRRKCIKSLHCKMCANLKINRKPSTIWKIKRAMKLRKITWNTFKGRKHSIETRKQMSICKKGRKVSDITKKRISKALKRLYKENRYGEARINEGTIAKHHIDLNKNNNNKNNLMYLKIGKHRQLHARAYDYLVKIGRVKQYIKWFSKKYEVC